MCTCFDITLHLISYDALQDIEQHPKPGVSAYRWLHNRERCIVKIHCEDGKDLCPSNLPEDKDYV